MEEIANPQIWALTFKILLTKALFSWIYNDHNEFDDVPPFGDVFANMGEFLETLQKVGGGGGGGSFPIKKVHYKFGNSPTRTSIMDY